MPTVDIVFNRMLYNRTKFRNETSSPEPYDRQGGEYGMLAVLLVFCHRMREDSEWAGKRHFLLHGY